jgi:acetoin utilization protein AcuB
MTPFPHSVEAVATVARARAVMDRHRIRHLPVTEGVRLVSIVSDRDIRRAMDPAGNLPPPEKLLVRDICPPEAYIVELTEPLDRVLSKMAELHIGSALVVRHGRLAGIFTVTDACRYFGRFLRELFPEGGDDEAA